MEIGTSNNTLILVVLIVVAYFLIFKKAPPKGTGDANKALENINHPLQGQAFINAENAIRAVNKKPFIYLKSDEANKRAGLVYGAKGYLKDTDAQAMDALKVKNREQVAQIAVKFSEVYKRSMIDYLKDFMDAENFNLLVERINKL